MKTLHEMLDFVPHTNAHVRIKQHSQLARDALRHDFSSLRNLSIGGSISYV